MKRSLLFLACLFFALGSFSQQVTQTLRGTVSDGSSRQSLPFVNIILQQNDKQVSGLMSDENGAFEFTDIPVGRYSITVSCLGYEPTVIGNILLQGGKQTVLEIHMNETAFQLNEVTVSGNTSAAKEKPLNSMAISSAKMFTVDEAHKYAGGFDDPSRLVTAFAGVCGSSNMSQNGAVVRGNAPANVLWTIDGVEIPNPNHFNGMDMEGGGFVSGISAQVLGNSDFYTGAFPAEFGNATSGVFDMRLKTGNNQTYESGLQLSTMGIDFFSEGPISKKSKASYLVNYRYSTLALVSKFGTEALQNNNLPAYQDLSFKLNFPTKKAGTFSVWGLGMMDELISYHKDTTDWHENEIYREKFEFGMNTGVAGLTHALSLSDKLFIKTSLVGNLNYSNFIFDLYEQNLTTHNYVDQTYTYGGLCLRSVANIKINPRHNNRTGIDISGVHHDYQLYTANPDFSGMINSGKYKQETLLMKAFSQSKINLSEKLTANLGLHFIHNQLNGENLIEPRCGLNYSFGKHSLNLAWGMHSRINPPAVNFGNFPEEEYDKNPNLDLKMTKAQHFVLGYDVHTGKNSHFKAEAFYQHLYDVPVIPGGTWSAINYMAEYTGVPYQLSNEGLGRNYGIDLSWERYLHKGFYGLITGSLFHSEYMAGDGNWYNTRYDYGYVINLIGGYEFTLKNENNRWGLNLRFTSQGGERHGALLGRIPVYILGDPLENPNSPFTERFPSSYYLDATLTYTINRPETSWNIGIMFKNLAGSDIYLLTYDYEEQKAIEDGLSFTYPNLFIKVNF